MTGEVLGERVRLRPFSASDVDDVFAYASDPEVSRYLDWAPHRTRDETAKFIHDCAERGALTLAIEDVDSRSVVGSFEIRVVDQLHRIGEIGYALARAYWGRGYNLDAGRAMLDHGFAELHLLRIQGVCDVGNRRSSRTMEKLGMVRERLLPAYRRRKGVPSDSYVYGILWREWARICSGHWHIPKRPRAG